MSEPDADDEDKALLADILLMPATGARAYILLARRAGHSDEAIVEALQEAIGDALDEVQALKDGLS